MLESIRERARKIKASAPDWAGDMMVALAIILVGFGAFGLGRISVQGGAGEAAQEPKIALQEAAVAASLPGTLQSLGGLVLASKSGTKYYFPWCSNNISEKNKVWFKDEAAARAAGYAPAKNCKGLE